MKGCAVDGLSDFRRIVYNVIISRSTELRTCLHVYLNNFAKKKELQSEPRTDKINNSRALTPSLVQDCHSDESDKRFRVNQER